MDNTQEVTLSLRNVESKLTIVSFRLVLLVTRPCRLRPSKTGTETRLTGEYRDPLTQSFIVDDPTGVYLTSVDIFFQRVPTDESTPVTVQIREVELGTPSQRILILRG